MPRLKSQVEVSLFHERTIKFFLSLEVRDHRQRARDLDLDWGSNGNSRERWGGRCAMFTFDWHESQRRKFQQHDFCKEVRSYQGRLFTELVPAIARIKATVSCSSVIGKSDHGLWGCRWGVTLERNEGGEYALEGP